MGAPVLAVDMRSQIPSSPFIIRSKKRKKTTASREAGCTMKEKTKEVRTGVRPRKHEETCRHCRRLDCPRSVNNGFDWLKPSMRCWCEKRGGGANVGSKRELKLIGTHVCISYIFIYIRVYIYRVVLMYKKLLDQR